MHLETLKQKLNLTPDQFGQFDTLEQFQIDHLSAMPECEQALIGELWRASNEVRETNWRGTPDDRLTAMRDLRIVQWKIAILNGINPHPPHQVLEESSIESFKAGLTEERVNFQFWMTEANGERCLGEMVFMTPFRRRDANRVK